MLVKRCDNSVLHKRHRMERNLPNSLTFRHGSRERPLFLCKYSDGTETQHRIEPQGHRALFAAERRTTGRVYTRFQNLIRIHDGMLRQSLSILVKNQNLPSTTASSGRYLATLALKGASRSSIFLSLEYFFFFNIKTP